MKIPTGKLFLGFLFLLCILLLMHCFPKNLSLTIHDRFNLNQEANIPTWFSTVLLFLISMCSLVIYHLRTNIVENNDRWNLFWLVFSSVYCFLSIDEAARLHEIIDQQTSIKWVYIYAPFGAIFFFMVSSYFWVMRRGKKSFFVWFIGGLVVYAIGGLFAEFISYYFYPLSPILQQFEFIMEEGLEMLGAIMVLMGCFEELNYLIKTKSD